MHGDGGWQVPTLGNEIHWGAVQPHLLPDGGGSDAHHQGSVIVSASCTPPLALIVY